MDVDFPLGQQRVRVHVEGPRIYGPERVLLDEDDDLTAPAWRDQGYTIAPFLPADVHAQLCTGVRALVYEMLVEAGYRGSEPELTRLHEVSLAEPEIYAAMIQMSRKCFDKTRMPIDPELVIARISELCGVPLCIKNWMTGMEHWCVRIVRPFSTDNNPLHRDVWLDRLRNAINIYAPIAGSNAESALPLIPGSHRWKESEIERTADGATVNGRAFTVPAVTGAKYPLAPIRPNPGADEVLVFSPYLVHGGGANFNADTTRVSLEIRFWRAS
jgi:hypothetical protein